ncbi:cytochrome c [Paraflavitalea speifideaquila]|uniref:c-type cytochrome n=1 Tax=Paraflavitalea speifideaquila TaxID=3076558 RepID=UPI0028ED8F30|nr:cytochrome c [Paraflavitalea speifideiaquila]
MNKEVAYVWQGFLLLLVILAGLGIVEKLATAKPTLSSDASLVLANEQNNSSSIAAYYNPRGQALFKAYCEPCHNLTRHAENFDLPRVQDRVPDQQLLRGWIRNSDSVLKTGNRYFNELYEKWNKAGMPPNPNLTDADIDEILEYIWRFRK